MPRSRFSLALMMLLVVTAASAAALGARIDRIWQGTTGWFRGELVGLLILAISANGVVLARWSRHGMVQALSQINVACLTLLAMIAANEWGDGFLVFRWLPVLLMLALVAPLGAIQLIQDQHLRSPRAVWWSKTAEVMACAAINLLAVGLELYLVLVLLIFYRR